MSLLYMNPASLLWSTATFGTDSAGPFTLHIGDLAVDGAGKITDMIDVNMQRANQIPSEEMR